MNVKQILLAVAAIVAFAGCDSNPYSSHDNLVPKAPPTPTEKPAPQKVYMLDAPFTVNCVEGLVCNFSVTFSVQNDTPVLSFENVPAGAQTDTMNGTFSWTPPRPDTDGQSYVILVNLRGHDDVEVAWQRSVVVIVKAKTP